MKKYIDETFEKLTPVRSDEEIFSYVLRRSEKMDSVNEKPRLRFKKAAVAACAAFCTVVLGITAAAAAGILDFDRAFGRMVSAESAELGENLLCEAENFNYTVSDSDYKIKLNGITGSASEVMVNLEISRADGAPLIESFSNRYDSRYGISGHDNILVYPNADDSYNRNIGGGGSYTVNNQGNVEVICRLGSSELNAYSLKNKKIRIEGAKLFPIDLYYEHIDPLSDGTNIENGELKYFKGNKQVAVDTSSVHYLDLSWSAEFVYIPSEIALKTIRKGYYSLDDVKLMAVYAENEKQLTDIKFHGLELTSTHMTIEGKLTDGVGELCFTDNEVYLIRKDGSRTMVIMDSGSFDSHGNFSCTFRYCSDFSENEDGSFFADYIAVDLTSIRSVEINGSVYKL